MTSILNVVPKVNIPEGKSGDYEIVRVQIEDNPVMRIREPHFESGEYTQLRRNGGLMMSDTPKERMDHWRFVDKATGNVLISGLGIGMCVHAVLLKPEVTSVTVLEISEDVINLVAPYYTKDKRVTVIHTDAMSWKPPKCVMYDAVWHDIWDDICTDNLPEMATLNRRYSRKARWKGCWSQNELRQRQREERYQGIW